MSYFRKISKQISAGGKRTNRRKRKPRGRLWKRAEDSLPVLHIHKYSIYDNGCVIAVSKKHPAYFTAYLHDKYEDEWKVVYCAYLDRGMGHISFTRSRYMGK